MRNKLIIILASLFLTGCSSPNLYSLSQKIESITVYDLEGLKDTKYSNDDLAQATKININPELIKEILPQAKHKKSWVLWKGSSLAILKLNDGSKKKIAVSYYGGFFSILGTYGYFLFEHENERNKFNKIFGDIIQNTFIPERVKRNK